MSFAVARGLAEIMERRHPEFAWVAVRRDEEADAEGNTMVAAVRAEVEAEG